MALHVANTRNKDTATLQLNEGLRTQDLCCSGTIGYPRNPPVDQKTDS
jgi:hypothetical protein